MKKIISNQKGATLLELIVSLSILLMLTIGVSGMIFNSINHQVLTEKKRNATNLGQMILEELSTVDEVEMKELIEINLPTLDNLKKNDSIKTIEGTYKQQYGSYDVVLEVTKALDLDVEQDNDGQMLFLLSSSQLITNNQSYSIQQTNSFTLGNSNEKYKIINEFFEQEFTSPTIVISVNDNSAENTKFNFNNTVDEWIILDIRYAVDNLSRLDIESTGKIKVRHIYNEQIQSDALEEFYHLTLTISLNNQELFKSYDNQFLKVREEESSEEEKGI